MAWIGVAIKNVAFLEVVERFPEQCTADYWQHVSSHQKGGTVIGK